MLPRSAPPAVAPQAALPQAALPTVRRERVEVPLHSPRVNVVSGIPAVPKDPSGVFVVRGAPSVPDASPIVRPGPLIIEMPASARR
jgi:hypothetical protein